MLAAENAGNARICAPGSNFNKHFLGREGEYVNTEPITKVFSAVLEPPPPPDYSSMNLLYL